MMKGLFVDDERNPQDVTWLSYPANVEWKVVRTYGDFEKAILTSDFDIISFDHDIQDFDDRGNERTGYTCFLKLLDYVMDEAMKMPDIVVHSQNPVGAKNIKEHYNNYLKYVG